MKKYIKYMFVVAMFSTSVNVYSQTTTEIFKYNSTKSTDAVVCKSILSNQANTNYGNNTDLNMLSFNPSKLKTDGTRRSLIRFDKLNTIPANALIVSAQLKFFGVPNSINVVQGNYPLCPNRCLNNNNIWLQRITSSWVENEVTWNNQPSSTTAGRVNISHTANQWDENKTVNSSLTSLPNLVNMLNIMKNENNYGFLMILDNETPARSLLFASSNNSNSDLWPELIVTYEMIDCEFNIRSSTTHQNTYNFLSTNSYGNHEWTIYDDNWDVIYSSISSSFDHTFASGSYYVHHRVYTDNQSCESIYMSLCVDPSQQAIASKSKKEIITNDNNIILDIIKDNSIMVYPNPSHDNWNVILTSETAEKVGVIIVDYSGKIVLNEKRNLNKGENSFIIDGSKFPIGMYLMEIKGENTSLIQKLSKK